VRGLLLEGLQRVLGGSRTFRRHRFGDGTFRRWWSQMFCMKKVFLKYAFNEYLVASSLLPRKLSRCRMCDERILRMVQRYANYGVTEYLRGIAHKF